MGMLLPLHKVNAGALAKRLEEVADLQPRVFAAAEPAPAHADQSDQAEAGVDWNDEMIPSPARAVHQKRFDVRFEAAQDRVARDERLPRRRIDDRLGGSHRTGVERTGSSHKANAYRHAQAVPFGIRHVE